MFEALTRRIIEPPCFGLDISDLSLKFCRITRRGRYHTVEYFGEAAIPEGIVVGGEMKQEADFAAVLREGLRTSQGRRVREKYCVVSLPEEKSFLEMISLPVLKDTDMANAVRWEIEGSIPLPMSEIYYDYISLNSILGSTPARSTLQEQHILVTAFPRGIVEGYHRAIARAGFIPVALELESQAISRALIGPDSRERGLIIVDIGTTKTSFILYGGGVIVFTKTISIGGQDFENAIVAGMNVSPEEARALKVSAGLDRAQLNGKLFELLVPPVASIISELQQQLWFYRDHPAKHVLAKGDVEHIMLCGGDANLIGLEKYIATTLKKLTILGNPFVNLSFRSGELPSMSRQQSLKYTTALGLALRSQSI